MERRETVQSLALLFIIVLFVALGSFFISIEELQSFVARAGLWGPLLLILLKASTIIFAPLSGSPLYPLAGVLFGPVYGLIYIVLGDMLGAAVSFMISRIYGKSVVERFLSKSNLAFLDTAISYMGTIKGFIITRIIFSPLPEVASYAAGLTKLRFVPFFIIHSTIGVIPAAILVWFGASLSFVESPWGLSAILLVGSVAAGVGMFIFFKFVQPKAVAEAKEEAPLVD